MFQRMYWTSVVMFAGLSAVVGVTVSVGWYGITAFIVFFLWLCSWVGKQ